MLLEVDYLMSDIPTNLCLIDQDVFQINVQLLDVNLILDRPLTPGGVCHGGPEMSGIELRCGPGSCILEVEATVNALLQTVDGATVPLPGVVERVHQFQIPLPEC